MTIIHRTPDKAKLNHGQLVMADLMPLKGAMAFGDIPSSAVKSGTTHVITIRYREDVGDVIEYGGEQWEVLSVFDPYAREDEEQTEIVRASRVRPTEVKPKRPSQARKFLKCLVKKV